MIFPSRDGEYIFWRGYVVIKREDVLTRGESSLCLEYFFFFFYSTSSITKFDEYNTANLRGA